MCVGTGVAAKKDVPSWELQTALGSTGLAIPRSLRAEAALCLESAGSASCETVGIDGIVDTAEIVLTEVTDQIVATDATFQTRSPRQRHLRCSPRQGRQRIQR